MTFEQGVAKAIMQALTKATRVAIMAVREMEILANNNRPMLAKSSGPVRKHPTFAWKCLDNFEIKVKNIFITNTYNIKESEKLLITVRLYGTEIHTNL